MPVLSTFLKSGSVFLNNTIIKSFCKPNYVLKTAVRHGGGYNPRKMFIHPSTRNFNKFNDMIHFYFLLGIIPLSAFVFYVNVTVGPAQLAPIPEDYDPKHWEYYKHPISRWFAKHIYPSHQEEYERFIFAMWDRDDRSVMSVLERKVQHLRSRRQDSKDAMDYREMPIAWMKVLREHADHSHDTRGLGYD